MVINNEFQHFQNEKGIALVVVIAVSAILLMALGAGYAIMTSALSTADSEVSRDQVMNVALAGIEEALAWFRSTANGKQAVKATFDPMQSGTRGTVPVTVPETQDTNCVGGSSSYNTNCVGIMRDFKIGLMNNLYGHYELRRTGNAVQDITNLRIPGNTNAANPPAGVVWRLEVNAYTYQRNSTGPLNPSNPGQNKIVEQVVMDAEIRRMVLTPPPATVSTFRGSNIQVLQKGQICNTSSNTAAYISQNPGNSTTPATMNCPIPGSNQIMTASSTQFNQTVDPYSLFGMSLSDLKTFVQNSPNGIYINGSSNLNKITPFPVNSTNPPLVYIENVNNANICLYNSTTNQRIDAFGVIVVDGGNVNICGADGNPCSSGGGGSSPVCGTGCVTDQCGSFTGFIYMKGTLNIDGGAVINGAVVAAPDSFGSVAAVVGDSSGTVITKLNYNGNFITGVLNQNMSNYAISRAPHIKR
jgi:hypothetical protein